jgi:ubiquinol-cytochrome c reductase cytochrome c subunit
MPRFTGNLSDAQTNDIVKFVTTYISHPQNPGGLGLGGLGPVAEGFIGLALGVGVLAIFGFWVGEREE